MAGRTARSPSATRRPSPASPSSRPRATSESKARSKLSRASQSPSASAPFKGTISIDAPVTLSPSSGSSLDGVRVAIQQESTEVTAANLLGTGSQAFTAAIVRNVEAGDDIYFRVGSVNNGANDEVAWN